MDSGAQSPRPAQDPGAPPGRRTANAHAPGTPPAGTGTPDRPTAETDTPGAPGAPAANGGTPAEPAMDSGASGTSGEPAMDSGTTGIGRRIRRLREERGISLSALARAAGVGKATLSGLENGTRNPTLETLWAITAELAP